MKHFIRFLVPGLLLLTSALPAAERIPPAPARYFNDYAGIVSPATAGRLNARLEQFERESSNQLLVAIYPRMESDSSVEDYTVRVAQAWRAGQKGRNNGAVLFAFMQEHKLYLQVGYGLEAVLPDVTAKRIIEDEIVPRFRARDMDGGMSAAVEAMIAAAKSEYKGTGRTRAEGQNRGGG
ncbi:MAG: TPM domain-containing protein, partial [Opitutales bacterium]